ncbi:MAG: guanylate kinase [Melioribacteraceae bacterium]|nr:guanylate kinase [Melioribacteraceae bacterium]
MSKIFVISAPSGAGKTTIVRNILSKLPEIEFSVSATTRKKRSFEIDGVDYFFLSDEEFKAKIEAKEFVEWETFYGYYYGTLKSFINSRLESGKSVLLEVDVKGALKIKKEYPEAVLIFILPPSVDELKRRLINRKTESEIDLQKRFERAEMEIDFQSHFEYKVVNNNLENAKEKVFNIFNKELMKEK